MGILQEEAAGQHERAHHGAPQACMCSPKRILETMGIGAMLGVMRLAVWRLPRTTEAVCSTTVGLRSVPAATFPPRAARADEQCTVRIIRAPHINSRRARYDGMSRLDEDVPTGLALLAARSTARLRQLWYRARTNFPSRRAVGSRVSALHVQAISLFPATYAGPVLPARPAAGAGSAGGSRAPSATARSPAIGRPARPRARCEDRGAIRPSSVLVLEFTVFCFPIRIGPIIMIGH